MQFKITLKVLKKYQLLPMSYQYELSAWIYKMIYNGNHEFATFLHEQGYHQKNKKFKFFTFSRLYISNFNRIDDRMEINCEEVSFVVSFFVSKIAQNMIVGMFQQEEFTLGDRITRVPFKVEAVQVLELNIPSNVVQLKTTAPLNVVQLIEHPNGKLEQKYLHPKDENFATYFIQNLQSKYEIARKHELIEDLDEDFQIDFQLLNYPIKRKPVRIKAHTPAETKVIGYNCAFELTAPKEMIKMGILSGFGRMNAEGFGATKILKK